MAYLDRVDFLYRFFRADIRFPLKKGQPQMFLDLSGGANVIDDRNLLNSRCHFGYKLNR